MEWKRGPRGLDGRHERFAQLVAAGKKPGEAFVLAGFAASNPNVLRAKASRLHRRMKRRISEIVGTPLMPEFLKTAIPELAKTAAVANIVRQTIEEFQRDLPYCRQKLHDLIEDKACPHAVRLGAIKECLNRGLGLPVQCIEQNLNVRYQISDRELTEDEWFARYAKPVDALPDPTEH
jgi:hypothetical protein